LSTVSCLIPDIGTDSDKGDVSHDEGVDRWKADYVRR
jgi:hypothetical protein